MNANNFNHIFEDEDTDSESTSEFNTGNYFENSKADLTEDYTILDRLGDGAFSIVYAAKRNSDQLDVAVKIIKKRKVSQEDLKREVEIWTRASSACSRVVQLYEIYEDTHRVYLVMELMIGGELFEKISKMTDYSEPYAGKIMKQLFHIILQLHKVDIIHQDLKPENLLLMGDDSTLLKLCDFGLAEIAGDDIELFGCVGSTTYMAPEVVNESGHHKPVDIYAAGVIMYIMLCGYPPFEPDNGIVELEFPDREWEDISIHAKELIVLLLDKDPQVRPTAEEALKHIWFHDVETIRNPKTLARAVNTLKKFQETGPNGTMKEYRGDTKDKRASVIGIFDHPESSSASTPSTNTIITSLSNMFSEQRAQEKSTGKKETVLPKLPSIPTNTGSSYSPKKKSGARTERNDKDKDKKAPDLMKKPLLQGGEKKGQHSVENLKSDKESKKKKKDKKKRASTSFVSVVQQSGKVEFDPKGMYSKDKKKGVFPDYSELLITDHHTESKKKKENRKSNRNSKKSDKKKSSSSLAKDLVDNMKLFDDPNIQISNVDDIIRSFRKELKYQTALLDYMKEECTTLKKKLQEETENCHTILDQFERDIAAARKTAEEERKERRALQFLLENLQTTIQTTSPPPTQPPQSPTPVTATKTQSVRRQNSKTNTTTNKKPPPSNPKGKKKNHN